MTLASDVAAISSICSFDPIKMAAGVCSSQYLEKPQIVLTQRTPTAYTIPTPRLLSPMNFKIVRPHLFR